MFDALTQEKRKYLLLHLNNFTKDGKHARLREALKAFADEAKRAQIIKNINMRLLKTISG